MTHRLKGLLIVQDVLSYHSNAVSEVMTESHVGWSLKRKIDHLGHDKRL